MRNRNRKAPGLEAVPAPVPELQDLVSAKEAESDGAVISGEPRPGRRRGMKAMPLPSVPIDEWPMKMLPMHLRPLLQVGDSITITTVVSFS